MTKLKCLQTIYHKMILKQFFFFTINYLLSTLLEKRLLIGYLSE